VRHGVALSRLQIGSKGRVVAALLRDADGNSTAVRSDIVIGADGRQSTVAAMVKAGTYLNGQSTTGYIYGYYEDLERYGYHWHFKDPLTAHGITDALRDAELLARAILDGRALETRPIQTRTRFSRHSVNGHDK
jgi:flavin-dependent dehydrogenase